MSKMTHGFFITINSMILYFKHIIHIDDFPLNGHPPSHYYIFFSLSLDIATHLSLTSLIFSLMFATHTYIPLLLFLHSGSSQCSLFKSSISTFAFLFFLASFAQPFSVPRPDFIHHNRFAESIVGPTMLL